MEPYLMTNIAVSSNKDIIRKEQLRLTGRTSRSYGKKLRSIPIFPRLNTIWCPFVLVVSKLNIWHKIHQWWRHGKVGGSFLKAADKIVGFHQFYSAACAMAATTCSQSFTRVILEHASSRKPINTGQGVQQGSRIILIQPFFSTLKISW